MAPVDYLAATGTLTFAAGETTKQVTVLVNGDLLDEANETYFLNLSNASQRNDCGRPGRRHDHERRRRPEPVRQRRNGDRRRLGHDERHLHRHAGSGQRAERECGLLDRGRYGDRTRRLRRDEWHAHVRPGPDHAHGRPCQVAGDTLDELDETFTVNLSNAVNAAIADGTGLGTILDDDPLPALSINDVTVTEPDSGHDERDVHGQPQRAERPRDLGRLRDRGRHGDGTGGLHRRLRQPHVRGRPDLQAGDGARQRRPARRGGRDLLRQPLRSRRTRRSPTGRASARSPTTTRCRRSPINDVTVTEGNAGTVAGDVHGDA